MHHVLVSSKLYDYMFQEKNKGTQRSNEIFNKIKRHATIFNSPMSIFTQIRQTTSMHIKEHEIKYLVKNDILRDKKKSK